MAKKNEVKVTAETLGTEVTEEATPTGLNAQQLVAKDLNEVLQLKPQINIELSEAEIEFAIQINAEEVYYKHPEHGTDALQASTFAYLLGKGYLTEPVVAEKPAKAPKAEKPAKPTKAEKPAGEKKGGFVKSPHAEARNKFIEALIVEGKYTSAEIVEKVMAKYPEEKKTSVQTIISDAKNAKYTKFGRVAQQDPDSKIMSF